MADVIEQLRECCRDSQGREMKDFAEPWGADCGLIRDAIAELEALRKRCEAVEAALKLARNRLQRLALECPHGSAIRNDACEWAGEATEAIAAAQEPSHG